MHRNEILYYDIYKHYASVKHIFIYLWASIFFSGAIYVEKIDVFSDF